jgi:hypothetical protein
MMHGREKSDLAIVVVKPSNEAGVPVEEAVERRAGATRKAAQQRTFRTQRRASVHQGLGRDWQGSALPSLTRGGSRMRESRTYGSVRGAGSNARPYRDSHENRFAEAETVAVVEGNMSVPVKRGPPLCRGPRPHHSRKDRVGTWEISRPTAGTKRQPALGRRGAEANDVRS